MTSAQTITNVTRDLIERHIGNAVDLSLADPLVGEPAGLDPLERVDAAIIDGFGSVVLTDHLEPVSPITAFVRDNASFRRSVPVTAGVVLNHEVGGLNVFAAEHCLMLSGRLVSMPTLSSQNYCRKFRRAIARASNRIDASLGDRLTLVDERFALRAELHEVLDLVSKHDAVLDAGYAHLSEVWVLVEEAKRHGISRILVRDPDRYAGALPDEIAALAEAGVSIGFTLQDATNDIARFGPYNQVSPERLILLMPPQAQPQGRLETAAAFLDAIMAAGASPDRIPPMMATAGARLVEQEERPASMA